jgi:20S proteasome alpha/beta subunit
MTTIVTTTGSNTAVLAADRGITSDLIHPDMPKIVQHKTWLIAVAGDTRACDDIQYRVNYPNPPVQVRDKHINDWYKWVVVNVVPLISAAITNKDDDLDAILVTHGRSFTITSTLGVISAMPYWAIGSGAELALGVLADQQYNPDWHKNHDLIARQAIAAASMHDPFTRGTVDLWYSNHTGVIYQG